MKLPNEVHSNRAYSSVVVTVEVCEVVGVDVAVVVTLVVLDVVAVLVAVVVGLVVGELVRVVVPVEVCDDVAVELPVVVALVDGVVLALVVGELVMEVVPVIVLLVVGVVVKVVVVLVVVGEVVGVVISQASNVPSRYESIALLMADAAVLQLPSGTETTFPTCKISAKSRSPRVYSSSIASSSSMADPSWDWSSIASSVHVSFGASLSSPPPPFQSRGPATGSRMPLAQCTACLQAQLRCRTNCIPTAGIRAWSLASSWQWC